MKEIIAALILMCGLLFAHPALAVETDIDLSEVMLIDTDDKVEIWFGHDMIATAPLGFTMDDAREQPELMYECYRLYTEEGLIANLEYQEYTVFNTSISFKSEEMSQTILGTIPF